jgi:hypothetical protein
MGYIIQHVFCECLSENHRYAKPAYAVDVWSDHVKSFIRRFSDMICLSVKKETYPILKRIRKSLTADGEAQPLSLIQLVR